MALNTKKLPSKSAGPKAEALEPGTFPARLVQIIDLGLQPQRPFQGQEKGPAYSVMFTYELVSEFMKDEDGEDIEDKPRWVSEDMPIYSLQADKAKSTKRYMVFDPEMKYDGDFSQVVAAPCSVTLSKVPNKKREGEFFNNITNVTPPVRMKGMKFPDLVNEPVVFDLSSPDLEVFNRFPEWLQTKIKENLEFAGSPLDRLLKGGSPAPSKEEEPDEDKPW